MRIVLILTLLLAGCPTPTVTDDDTDVGDDDTTADDQPDTVTVTGAAECGPIASVMALEYEPDGPPELTVLASTLDDLCGLYLAHTDTYADAYHEHWDEYLYALGDEDGPRACAELLAWYETHLPAWAALNEPGSCTVTITLESHLPGTYQSEAAPGAGSATVSVIYPDMVDTGMLLDAFGGCASVTDWDSWNVLVATVGEVQWWSAENWWDTGGTIDLQALGNVTFVLDAMGMTIEEVATGEPGTLGFHLTAPPCVVTPPPDYLGG